MAINVPDSERRRQRVLWGIVSVDQREKGWWTVQVARAAHVRVERDCVVIVPTHVYSTVTNAVAANCQMTAAEAAALRFGVSATAATAAGTAGGAIIGASVAAAVGDSAIAATAGFGAACGGAIVGGAAASAGVIWGVIEAGKMSVKLHKWKTRMRQWEARGATMPKEWLESWYRLKKD